MQPRLKLPWYRLGQWAGRGAAHRHQVSGLSVVLAMAVACAGVGLLCAGEPVQYSVEGRRSGYTYLLPENQRLQDDEFANPGLLWVEQGRELWHHADGAGASCATCHGEAVESMRGVRTRYPHFDPQRGKLINLEQQINRCREAHMQAPAYPYESAALLALTTFVSFQSRGLPMDVRSDGPAAPFFEAGKVFSTSGAASSTSPARTATTSRPDSACVVRLSARGRPMASPSTATSGRLWARRIACSPGATPLCEPSPTRTAPTNTSTLSCSWPGGAVAYPSKPRRFGAESPGMVEQPS